MWAVIRAAERWEISVTVIQRKKGKCGVFKNQLNLDAYLIVNFYQALPIDYWSGYFLKDASDIFAIYATRKNRIILRCFMKFALESN